MKFEHKLDPLLQLSKPNDSILTYGCFKVSLHFMLKPIGVEDLTQFQTLMPKMAKACCDVIDAHNKEEDAKCLGTLNPENPAGGISLEQPPEKS